MLGMVKVKGVEWSYVLVVKELECYGMVMFVCCVYCGKEFQGNVMCICVYLLGNKCFVGVFGCFFCFEEVCEEFCFIDIVKLQVKWKCQDCMFCVLCVIFLFDYSFDSVQQQMDFMVVLQKGEKLVVEQVFWSMVFQVGGLFVNYVNFLLVKLVV